MSQKSLYEQRKHAVQNQGKLLWLQTATLMIPPRMWLCMQSVLYTVVNCQHTKQGILAHYVVWPSPAKTCFDQVIWFMIEVKDEGCTDRMRARETSVRSPPESLPRSDCQLLSFPPAECPATLKCKRSPSSTLSATLATLTSCK